MRGDWDSYFMRIAREVASRATCPRGSVGAVFVRDNDVLVTGYNGSVSGTPHCDEVPPEVHVVNGHCDIALHAELNAIIRAARKGVLLRGSTLYCTKSPCWYCIRAILNLGVYRIVYDESYRPEPRIAEYCAKKSVLFEPLKKQA